MSDTEITEVPTAEIVIKISQDDLSYESELPLPDVYFWLGVVRSLIMKKTIESDH